jgi:hypothetical protein
VPFKSEKQKKYLKKNKHKIYDEWKKKYGTKVKKKTKSRRRET